ncbi:protein NIM1-INTERACTING 2 [Melia azedarach]|uniref:Protein NIM1-INTERACTING 2 n=1 Tax=Melia azedarach TaxID=155640 RepID=A0ACC1XGK0_MELAZ|nr:protein NIM1-INTERACTING 2 [Melia azedarach]
MEGEGEKRKRIDDDGKITNGKRTKGGNEAEQTVTEEEVEEFFAILRRIRVAVKYFEKGNKDGRRKLTDTRWRPCFQAEDFDEHNSVNNDSNMMIKEESGEQNSSLDLNSDPASSKNSH